MGGVDLCDMFHALYRIERRSKRWYIRIVYYLISVCVTNAWLIYKINNKGNKMALREFTLAVSDSLMRCGKNTKAGRPTLQRNINIDNLTKAEKNA